MSYRIKNLKLKIKKRGFTLIEMMIAVFVFMILFLIAASFVNLAAGSTKSNRTKLLTSDLRNALDVISQKMNNANGRALDIYGFKVNNNNILGIASSDGSCTFFGKNNNNTPADIKDDFIAMKYLNSCNGWPVQTDLDQKLTDPKNITVTNVSFTLTDPIISNSPTKSPYLKVVIEAQDADAKYENDNKIKLETSYTMDYLTIKKFKTGA
ncbi:MAG: prepilin-type N-terminal cleavage/methylation domain-containing protein [Patescibacteria group bacterium]|nr:prepilin-type N-terminal cleavage/methylation domain-containing protein [Patescibacteria group bacterium]